MYGGIVLVLIGLVVLGSSLLMARAELVVGLLVLGVVLVLTGARVHARRPR